MRCLLLVLCLAPLAAAAENGVYPCTRYRKTETVITNLPNCGVAPKSRQADKAAAGRLPTKPPTPVSVGASGPSPERRRPR